MMLGMYGLIYELASPGAILPGVVGGICILLAFFSFQALPVNIIGVLLILFGILLLVLEVKVTSFGALTIGGATSLLLGSMMLIDTNIPALKVSLGVIIPTVVATVLFALFAIGMGLRAQARKIATGREGLIGEIGEAFTDIDPKGKVLVSGEYWNARSDVKIQKGQTIRVATVKGMLIKVEPADDEN